MSLRPAKTASDDDRHAAWTRVIERVYGEQQAQGWRHQCFRTFRAVFQTNRTLGQDGGFIFNWVAEMYVESSLMLVRRELDLQSGTENLRNLLEDIAEHPHVLTRARYQARWEKGEQGEASEAFNSFKPTRVTGSPAADHIDPAVVRADLRQAIDDGDRVRTYAERTRAHRTPMQGIDTSLTFQEMHQAIDDIRRVVSKYYALLKLGVVTEWEPVAQYDTVEPFTRAWVRDREAVIASARRESI